MKILLLQEFRSNWRSFRYPAFLLVVLFFALLDPPMMIYMDEILGYFAEGMEIVIQEPTPEDVFASYLSDVSQIGILVLIFVIMGSVAREKLSGVTGWMLSKPISRWQYLAAKLIVHYTVIIIGLLASSSITYLYTMSLLGKVSLVEALWCTIALISYIMLIATLTFTFSTILNSPLQAGGLAIVVFFLSGILNLFISNTAVADYYPNTLIGQIVPLVKGAAVPADIAGALAVTLGLCLLLAILTGIRFARMEL